MLAVTKKDQFGVRATCGDKLVFKTISYYLIIPFKYHNARGFAVERTLGFCGLVCVDVNGVIAVKKQLDCNYNVVIVGIKVSYLRKVR